LSGGKTGKGLDIIAAVEEFLLVLDEPALALKRHWGAGAPRGKAIDGVG